MLTSAAIAAADFTATELGYLASWGRANRLEVVVEVAGSDLDEEVAYIGPSVAQPPRLRLPRR